MISIYLVQRRVVKRYRNQSVRYKSVYADLTLFSHESGSSVVPLGYVEIRTLCQVCGDKRRKEDNLQKLLRCFGLPNRI